MANKKISQLTDVGDVQVDDLFPLAENAGAGSFVTKSCTSQKLSEYVLNPVSATQVSGLNKSVYLNNNDANWDTASNVVTQNPYLQVRQSDGLLVTGSGIGNAVGGDNMGDCIATTDLNLQNNVIVNANEIYFGGGNSSDTLIEYDLPNPATKTLKVQAKDDLILSGQRYVRVSGQALDLADTPVSGNVTFNNGDLTVATPGKLTIDEITLRKRSATTPHSNGTNTAVDWSNSSIQYMTAGSSPHTFTFSNTVEGQMLTMYVENTLGSDITVNFPSAVEWGGEYDNASPNLVNAKTTLYTFVKINTNIFASAVTNGDIIEAVAFGTFSVANMNASNLTSGTIPNARYGTH